jgi:hypothetical protein
MNSTAPHDWLVANQRHLMAALGVVRQALERHAAQATAGVTPAPPTGDGVGRPPAPAEQDAAPTEKAKADQASEGRRGAGAASVLEALCAAFGLSPFERDVLLLCAGRELDGKFAALCAAAQGDPRREHPTLSLALAALPGPHWSALTPEAPLRHWRLIEAGPGDTLATAPLRIDERVLHYLTGVNCLDERLRGLVQPVEAHGPLPPSQQTLARRVAEVWTRRGPDGAPAVIQLSGPDVEGRRAVALAAGAPLRHRLHALRAGEIPAAAAERETWARLWDREAILSRSALLIEAGDDDTAASARGWMPFVESLGGVVFVSRRDPLLQPAVDWDDLVLPDDARRVLREIAAQVRQRFRVYDEWGFAAKSARGLGISALFAGPSGTGKTMAAEVLAGEPQLDLYRIDLSAVVSKYIGETEKNLRRIFDAVEDSGVILLFDEADALFGKRSEVKDSHDRYANIEVSYLLQRMEAYRGLAILTTNQKAALDTAFLRRLRFVVLFPFPDATQRAEIWRRIFPARTPLEGLELARLALLNVPGGNIRNIALNAAFLAADEGQPVRMTHLLRAARTEYAKLEKPLTEAETKGWM